MARQYTNHWMNCGPMFISPPPPMTVIMIRGPALNFSMKAGSFIAFALPAHGTR